MKYILTLILLLSLSGCINTRTQNYPTAEVNGEVFNLHIAVTDYDKNVGLSKYYTLSQDWGMMFVYEEEQELRFYMKDMRFPIDMIWLNENATVEKILSSLEPCKTNCTTYSGWGKYVLEINAGLSEELNITEGTQIKLKFTV